MACCRQSGYSGRKRIINQRKRKKEDNKQKRKKKEDNKQEKKDGLSENM